jgi:hypothetical protein
MKKKIMMFSLFTLATLLSASLVSASTISLEQRGIKAATVASQREQASEAPQGVIRTAYLVVFVITFTPGAGIQPCPGAEVRVRGLLHSYNGTTDDKGLHLFAVHTSFLREKLYFITVSMVSQDHVVKRTAFLHLRSWQVVYRAFLFLQPAAS